MKNITTYLFLLIVGLSMYLFTIKGIYGNPTPKEIKEYIQATQPFELSPERGRYALVVSLAEDKPFYR